MDLNDNLRVVLNILFTDKATFTWDAINSSSNCHLWLVENAQGTVKTHFQIKFFANHWYVDGYLIGTFIFENRLTRDEYLSLLQKWLLGLLEDVSLKNFSAWWSSCTFQSSDQATLECNISTGRWIGRRGPIIWPARLPNITVLDFWWLDGYKNEIYNLQVNRMM